MNPQGVAAWVALFYYTAFLVYKGVTDWELAQFTQWTWLTIGTVYFLCSFVVHRPSVWWLLRAAWTLSWMVFVGVCVLILEDSRVVERALRDYGILLVSFVNMVQHFVSPVILSWYASAYSPTLPESSPRIALALSSGAAIQAYLLLYLLTMNADRVYEVDLVEWRFTWPVFFASLVFPFTL